MPYTPPEMPGAKVCLVFHPHTCDFCLAPAIYDAKTAAGPWAYLCDEHAETNQIRLGLGWGQRLRVSP